MRPLWALSAFDREVSVPEALWQRVRVSLWKTAVDTRGKALLASGQI